MPDLKTLIERQHRTLERLTKKARAFANRVVRRAINDAATRVGAFPGHDYGNWGYVSERAVLYQLERAAHQLVDDATNDLNLASKTAATYGYRDTRKFLRAAARLAGVVRPLRFDLVAWLSKEEAFRINAFRRSLERYSKATSDTIRQTIAESVLIGQSWSEAADRIAKIVPSSIAKKRWMLERIARTEMAHAYNGTAHEFLVREDRAHDPMLKRLVATIDDRTAWDSLQLNKQTVPVRQPFINVDGTPYTHPPNRPNDREIVVGWHKSYEKFLPDI